MAASDHLGPMFKDYVLRFTPGDVETEEPHTVEAYSDATKVGYLDWHAEHGEIEDVDVLPEHQRKGIATAMYQRAQEVARTQNLVEPVHSNLRSPSGDAWAQRVGGHNSRPYKVEWM